MTRVASLPAPVLTTVEATEIAKIEAEKSKPLTVVADVADAKNPAKSPEPTRANVRGTGGGVKAELEARLDKKANTPEVAKLLDTYLGDGTKPVGRPAERFLGWVAYIDNKLKEGGVTGQVVDIAVKDDLRRRVFLLEGIMKMYKGELGKEMDGQFEVAKALEDFLGKYTYAISMTKTAVDKGAPQPVIDYLKKCEVDARESLEGHIRDNWMPNENGKIPGIKKLVKTITKADFEKYKVDREFIQKKIAKELKEIDETDFDMKDLEGGLHELRRQLRWVPVFCEATAGLVQLDDTRNPSKFYEPMLQTKLASDKYIILPTAEREKSPINVSKSLYTANMDYVLKLGAIKDMGEQIHGMERAYTETGLAKSPEEAHTLALALLKLDAAAADFSAQGQKIYDEMRDNELLKTLRHDIKEQ